MVINRRSAWWAMTSETNSRMDSPELSRRFKLDKFCSLSSRVRRALSIHVVNVLTSFLEKKQFTSFHKFKDIRCYFAKVGWKRDKRLNFSAQNLSFVWKVGDARMKNDSRHEYTKNELRSSGGCAQQSRCITTKNSRSGSAEHGYFCTYTPTLTCEGIHMRKTLESLGRLK